MKGDTTMDGKTRAVCRGIVSATARAYGIPSGDIYLDKTPRRTSEARMMACYQIRQRTNLRFYEIDLFVNRKGGYAMAGMYKTAARIFANDAQTLMALKKIEFYLNDKFEHVETERKMEIEVVLDMVKKYFGVSDKRIKAKDRITVGKGAKQWYCYLAKEMTNYRWGPIAGLINCSPQTAIYHKKEIQNLLRIGYPHTKAIRDELVEIIKEELIRNATRHLEDVQL